MSYGTDYLSLSFLSIGGLGGYAVMRIADANGQEKLRLAKCKKTRDFPETDKWVWEEVDPGHINDLSQVNHINFKSEKGISLCFEKLQEANREDPLGY
ncbi:MAG: hypothetical protein ACOC35_13770 [Promethearchaeia archaeon]